MIKIGETYYDFGRFFSIRLEEAHVIVSLDGETHRRMAITPDERDLIVYYLEQVSLVSELRVLLEFDTPIVANAA